MIAWPGNDPPKISVARCVPTTGTDKITPVSTLRLPPESMSSGRMLPDSPAAMPASSRPTQISQSGSRNRPRKNTRTNRRHTAATNRSADQWCTCRISSPARTSKLMFSVDWYARLIVRPSSLR